MKARGAPKLNLEKYGSLIALGVLAVASTIVYPRFVEPQNLLNILRQVSYTGIIGLGMTFVIIAGGIDLSVGSMAALSGSVAILMLNLTTNALSQSPGWMQIVVPILCAILVAALIGMTSGFINGFLVTKGKIAPFIVTLGTMAIFRSPTPLREAKLRYGIPSYTNSR